MNDKTEPKTSNSTLPETNCPLGDTAGDFELIPNKIKKELDKDYGK